MEGAIGGGGGGSEVEVEAEDEVEVEGFDSVEVDGSVMRKVSGTVGLDGSVAVDLDGSAVVDTAGIGGSPAAFVTGVEVEETAGAAMRKLRGVVDVGVNVDATEVTRGGAGSVTGVKVGKKGGVVMRAASGTVDVCLPVVEAVAAEVSARGAKGYLESVSTILVMAIPVRVSEVLGRMHSPHLQKESCRRGISGAYSSSDDTTIGDDFRRDAACCDCTGATFSELETIWSRVFGSFVSSYSCKSEMLEGRTEDAWCAHYWSCCLLNGCEVLFGLWSTLVEDSRSDGSLGLFFVVGYIHLNIVTDTGFASDGGLAHRHAVL